MRHVERGPAPPLVQSPEFQRLWAGYRSFRASGGSRVTQTRLGSVDFVGMLEPLAGDYVRSLFRGRCAYTERDGRLVLHLHRPESDAFDDRLGVSADHYWWTAGWYRNWYAASYELVGLKRTTFPVLGDRALVPPGSEGQHDERLDEAVRLRARGAAASQGRQALSLARRMRSLSQVLAVPIQPARSCTSLPRVSWVRSNAAV